MKTMTALELENIGIPYSDEDMYDMWHTDNGTIMYVFKLDDRYYGVEAWPYPDNENHWWSIHEDENAIPLIEMEAKEVTYTRFFPASDI